MTLFNIGSHEVLVFYCTCATQMKGKEENLILILILHLSRILLTLSMLTFIKRSDDKLRIVISFFPFTLCNILGNVAP